MTEQNQLFHKIQPDHILCFSEFWEAFTAQLWKPPVTYKEYGTCEKGKMLFQTLQSEKVYPCLNAPNKQKSDGGFQDTILI